MLQSNHPPHTPPPPPTARRLNRLERAFGALFRCGQAAFVLVVLFLLATPAAQAQISLFSFTSSTQEALEGSELQVRLLIVGATAPVTVRYRLIPQQPGSSIAAATLIGPDADVTDPNNGSSTFQPSDADAIGQVSFPITIVDDSAQEPTEEFAIELLGFVTSNTVAVESISGFRRLRITASDRHTLTITGPAALTETDTDFMSGDYTITRTGDEFTTNTVVDLIVTHTTTDADDISVPASVTFAAGAATQTFQVTVRGDSINEAAEMFSLRTSGVGSGATHAAAHSVTINDNDDITSVTVADAPAVQEGESATFTVTLDKASAGIVTVAWTADIGGTMGGTPEPASGSLQIPAGSTAADISIRIPSNADLGDGDSRTLTVTLGTVTIASPGRGTVTTSDSGMATINYITDDTTPPQLAAQNDQPGWSGGQSVLWLQVNEDFKILPYPDGADGATVPAETPSGTTLDSRDFTIIENSGNPSSATIAVNSIEAVTQHRALKLTLARAIAANAQNLQVAYERVGSQAIYDTAVERGLVRNNRRNLMAAETLVLMPNATADADTDGIPDAVEARIATDAGNPFVEVTPEQQPTFSISRTASQEPIAYSGIRAQGVQAHLGVSSVATTEQTAAQRVAAYYRSDTFGHDGTYQCDTGQFPANYDAPLADGGCAPVDWGNIAPGVDHTIAWLVQSDEGVWAVNLNTDSNLPEQTIYRIPELNMASQRLFTTGAAVTVRATADDGRSFTVSASADGVWTVDQVAGSSVTLWRPSPTPPTASDYSLGLTTQTVVVVAAAGSVIPPVPGRPLLMRGADVVNALAEGSAHELHIPLENGGVITTETHTIASAELAGLAGTVTDVAVRLPGGGGSVSAVFRYPVVSATNHPLASSGDADGDGIADMLDDFDALSHLPVSATEAVRHIRPVFRSHRLRAGDETLARVAAADTVDYNAWQASEFATGSVVYDFTIYEVDYAAVSSATPTGGMAGVIIPLPQAFRGAGVEVFKVGRGQFDRSGGDRYGFAMRRTEDGGCPDDADGLYSLASGDCLAVYVTDGGPNDDDGVANGVIKDPLGVRIGGGGGSGSSGALGLVALIVLAMLAALLLLSAARRCRRTA